MPGTPFFTWPRQHVRDHLGEVEGEIAFIPFAAVTLSADSYEETVSRAFTEMGYRLRSVHRVSDKKKLIRAAAAIVVGGGNTFALVKRMYDEDLMTAVRTRVMEESVPYVGWSAGANLACPALKTTNDMPIVLPPSFDALKLVPFQINPHYHELKFENQGGETRRERLQEYLVMNPGMKVVGLPEGTFLRRNGETLVFGGNGTGKLYAAGDITPVNPGQDLSLLLRDE